MVGGASRGPAEVLQALFPGLAVQLGQLAQGAHETRVGLSQASQP